MKHLFNTAVISSFVIFSSHAHAKSPELRTVVIKGVNAIVDEVQAPYAVDELTNKFDHFGNKLSEARVVFFGEFHGDKSGHDQVRALNYLFKPKDIVLYEGGKAGDKRYCGTVVLDLFIYAILRHLEAPYSPAAYSALEKELEPVIMDAFSELRLRELAFTRGDCFCWDSPEEAYAFLEEKEIDFIDGDESLVFENKSGNAWLGPLTRRNSAMVSEIRKHTNKGRRVFVVAGVSAHLPTGDLKRFQKHFELQPDKMSSLFQISRSEVQALTLPQYYELIANVKSDVAKRYIEAQGMGSTKVIYDFLESNDLTSTEMIPKALGI